MMSLIRRIQTDRARLDFNTDHGLLEQWTTDQDGVETQHLYPPSYAHPSIPGWPDGGCPILFPWGGRVWSNSQLGAFSYLGRVGKMPVHGEAYLRKATIEDRGNDWIRFKSSSPDSALPWQHTVLTTYRLDDRKVSIELEIHNLDHMPMPVAPGIHPFFKLNDLANWRVTIPAGEAYAVNDRGLAGESRAITINARPANDPELQSLILGKLSAHSATIKHSDTASTITVHWQKQQSNSIVLWTNNSQGYFCLEPWAGLPDAVHNGKGLHQIAPATSQTFQYAFTLD